MCLEWRQQITKLLLPLLFLFSLNIKPITVNVRQAVAEQMTWYDMIWWTILTCAQKLTCSQLSLPHISVLDWWLIQNKPRRSSAAVETTSRVRRRIWRTERCRPLVGTLASQRAHFLLHTAQHTSCDSTCQSTLQFIIWQQPITEHWKLKTPPVHTFSKECHLALLWHFSYYGAVIPVVWLTDLLSLS